MFKHTLARAVPMVTAISLLTACATRDSTYQVPSARIADGDGYQNVASDEADSTGKLKPKESGFQQLTPLSAGRPARLPGSTLGLELSSTDAVTFAADEMPLPAFVHAVMGEILKLNYVLADEVSNSEVPVTLNLQSAVSSRELYRLVAQVLDAKGMAIQSNEGIYYVGPKAADRKGGQSIGIGRSANDVPQVVGPVMQIVPIRYGINIGMERTLNDLVNARIVPDFEKNVLFITAERAEVVRALDLVNLLDLPPSRSQHVGILRLTYTNPEQFINKLADLLKAEGIPVDAGRSDKGNLVLIPLEQIGAVAVFGSDKLYIDRVNYWYGLLDKPSEGGEKRYYVFHPRFARAADLGNSIGALLTGNSTSANNRQGNQSRDTASAFATGNQVAQPAAGASNGANRTNAGQNRATAASQQGATSVKTDTVTMTVDERSNTLIFYTSGVEYQTLLPMIRRLDVMPKQILLEATIAEVTLNDNFALGVEFALANGKFGATTVKALGATTVGGMNLSYIDGADNLLLAMKETNSDVNILSNPSVVVRDGVTANSTVGTDVPTVGSTTINPGTETQSTTVEYRKTGVKLSVTPTINAQGLVVMAINLNISNTEEGSTVPGAPFIFERAVDTEVLAQSGQTVMLAGLMSENKSKSLTKVPLLGDMPLLGPLFQSQKDSLRKTELVILITPKVIDQPEQWQQIRQKLDNGLNLLKVQE